MFIGGVIIRRTFDVVNQTMVAVPLIFLFEVGLFLAWLAEPSTEGNRLNPLRWPLVRNVYAPLVGLLLTPVWAGLAVAVIGWHVMRLALDGKLSRLEQDSLRLRVEDRIIGPYLALLRRLGVVVEP